MQITGSMARTHVAVFLAAALSIFLPGESYGQSLVPPPGAGEKLFLQYCSSCHGAKGDGTGPVADQLRIAPLDLQKIAMRRGNKFPEAEIIGIIDGRTGVAAHGSREMPVWGRVFSDKFGSDEVSEEATRGYLTAILEHLKSIQK